MTTPLHRATGTSGRLATALRVGTRLAQFGLLVLVGYTLAIGEIGLAINAALMLGVALLPDLLWHRYDYRINPVLSLLIALSPLLHALGAMGLYEGVPMFDQAAHAASSALVAGAGYVVVQVVDDRFEGVEIPGRLRFAFVLVFVMAFGVFWEIGEFATDKLAVALGQEEVLVQHGLTDTIMDMLFNTIAAVIVAVWGTTYFDGVRQLVGRQVDEDG